MIEFDSNSCHLFLDGTFSFDADLNGSISCIGFDGITTCGGSNNILIDFRYWIICISVYRLCGFGQCCQLDEYEYVKL